MAEHGFLETHLMVVQLIVILLVVQVIMTLNGQFLLIVQMFNFTYFMKTQKILMVIGMIDGLL